MKEILLLKNIVKAYGSDCPINEISLSVSEGEKCFIHGGRGCGKTTLLRLIAGIERSDFGEMIAPEKIGVLQEEDAFIPEYTILENIAFPLAVCGDRTAKTLAFALLDLLGIRYIAGAKLDKVSKYERRAAALARACITKPDLLLIDELTAGFPEREEKLLERNLEELRRWCGNPAIIRFGVETNLKGYMGYMMQYGKITEDENA